ncbi:MAG: YbaB/EbfC family nucleoid-associated protein, partial [Dolichospermum sp.]
MTGKGQGFGFGLGKMKELAEAFKKAQEVQAGAKRLQEELEEMEILGESGGGLV